MSGGVDPVCRCTAGYEDADCRVHFLPDGSRREQVRCNCENSACTVDNRHAGEAHEPFRACVQPAYRGVHRVEFVGPVCRWCFEQMPERYRLPAAAIMEGDS